jgi:hypothetical protein
MDAARIASSPSPICCGSRADYGDLNDAARLTQDPTLQLIGSKIWERGPALTSRLQSFETTLLTQADKLPRLAALYPGRAPPAAAQR